MDSFARERLTTLDLLRGVAALAVATRHFPWVAGAPFALPGSYLAVDLFFALSGFVVAGAYGPMLDRGEASAFLRRRIARLYPLYALATLVGAAIWLGPAIAQNMGGLLGWAASLSCSLAFLPTPSALTPVGMPADPYPLVGPSWSLWWELLANAALAYSWRPRPAGRGHVAVIGGGALLLLLAVASWGSLDVGWRWSDFAGGGCRVVFSFATGVALCRWRHRVPTPVIRGELLAALVLACFMAPDRTGLLAILAILLVFPACVLLGATATLGDPAHALGRWLGDRSYAVYLLQGPVLAFLTTSLKVDLGPFGWAGLATYLAVTLAVGDIATRWVEEPIRGLWRRARSSLPSLTTTLPVAP